MRLLGARRVLCSTLCTHAVGGGDDYISIFGRNLVVHRIEIEGICASCSQPSIEGEKKLRFKSIDTVVVVHSRAQAAQRVRQSREEKTSSIFRLLSKIQRTMEDGGDRVC